LTPISSFAENQYFIRGTIISSHTDNPISDATIKLSSEDGKNNNYEVTNLMGGFVIPVSDPYKIYSLEVSHISYHSVKLNCNSQEKQTVILTKLSHQLEDVIVTSGRGLKGITPGALSNIDRSTLNLIYSGQDIPHVIAEVPSATIFNWSGGDIGAAEIRIRGFDQKRISATVNGVPINDPEDHNIYWQDTPDFVSNTFDIQVERGVSNFAAGPAGIGGSINIITSDAVSEPEFKITYQGGTYNTSRQAIAYRSGIVNDKYNFTGRFSKVKTDGYRDHTAADMWSYFIAGTRLDANMITRLQVYGGEEEMEAYWWGLDKATLGKNRKANYSAKYMDYMGEYFWESPVNYHDERDFFQQPHYMLHNQWQLIPSLELDQSLFYIKGDGYYEEWKLNRKFAEYNLTPFEEYWDSDDDGVLDSLITISRSDLIRRKSVSKHHYGWIPELKWKYNSDLNINFGLELRSFRSTHYGKVMWARNLPDGIDPQHEWYRWKGKKSYMGGFANLSYALNPKTTLSGGLQIRNLNYEVEQDSLGVFTGIEYEVDYLFLNPRLGITHKVDDDITAYLSFATTSREPIDDQIYDPDNPVDVPKLSKFGKNEIDPEQMIDVELGINRNIENLSMGINAYGMFFKNEIVSTGFSSELDEEIFENVPTSTHVGIELEASHRDLIPGLTLSGNLSYGSATLGEYSIVHVDSLSEYWDKYESVVNLKGNKLARFPDLIFNSRITYKYSFMTASLHVQHISEQFMDNREDEQAKLAAYTLLNATFIANLTVRAIGQLDLELRIMNLGDLEYEPFGIVEVEYGVPYYVPAAGRRFMAGINLNL